MSVGSVEGGAQHDDGVGGWFLHGFEECVGCFVGESIGIVQDDDAPLADGWQHRGGGYDPDPHGVDADAEFAGGDVDDIGVGTRPGFLALFAFPAADDGGVGAFQRGGEGDGGGGAPGTWRAGE